MTEVKNSDSDEMFYRSVCWVSDINTPSCLKITPPPPLCHTLMDLNNSSCQLCTLCHSRLQYLYWCGLITAQSKHCLPRWVIGELRRVGVRLGLFIGNIHFICKSPSPQVHPVLPCQQSHSPAPARQAGRQFSSPFKSGQLMRWGSTHSQIDWLTDWLTVVNSV